MKLKRIGMICLTLIILSVCITSVTAISATDDTNMQGSDDNESDITLEPKNCNLTKYDNGCPPKLFFSF